MVDTKVPLSSICHNYNLYITLRCKIVARQAAHKLADALPAMKGKEVTVSSRLFRSLRLLHNRQLAVLVNPPPPQEP